MWWLARALVSKLHTKWRIFFTCSSVEVWRCAYGSVPNSKHWMTHFSCAFWLYNGCATSMYMFLYCLIIYPVLNRVHHFVHFILNVAFYVFIFILTVGWQDICGFYCPSLPLLFSICLLSVRPVYRFYSFFLNG